jgi:hypothetical protein
MQAQKQRPVIGHVRRGNMVTKNLLKAAVKIGKPIVKGVGEFFDALGNKIGALPNADVMPPIDYLKKMQKCVSDGGGFSNCHLAVQLTTGDSDFSKLEKIKIDENNPIVKEWFDEEGTSRIEKMLNAGDVLNFDQRHYGIYDGKDIVQIPEWGADPERVDMKSVFKSSGPPTEIIIPSIKNKE